MTDHLLYLSLPPYLAQWYADECRRNEQAHSGTPVETEAGYRYCPVKYLFSQEQVHVAH